MTRLYVLDTETGDVAELPSATTIATATGQSVAAVLKARRELLASGLWTKLTEAQAVAITAGQINTRRS